MNKLNTVCQKLKHPLTCNATYNESLYVNTLKHLPIPETVLFLGIAVLAALLIILLVQFIAEREVCTIDVPLQDLPKGVQQILTGGDQQDSWQCPYSKLLFNSQHFMYFFVR